MYCDFKLEGGGGEKKETPTSSKSSHQSEELRSDSELTVGSRAPAAVCHAAHT